MLVLNQIQKTFAHKIVAHHIDLSVQQGNILAILGPSGCGKSTLLNMIAGLVTPDSGEIWLNGQAITTLPPEKRQIALMFQDYALLPHLNVWQNVAFGLKMRGIAPSVARQQAEAMLAKLGLAAESERKIEHLSGGEQQRVALARALVVQPHLLLLDEPFSSLDTGLRHALRDLTAEQIRQQAIPALLVTHDPEEALLMADQIALMHEGKIIQHGSTDTLLNRPVSAWAARLLGCINVYDDYYIPPAAIQLDKTQGTACPLLQIQRLPEINRIVFHHPRWGILSTHVSETTFAHFNIGTSIHIHINEQLMIQFTGA